MSTKDRIIEVLANLCRQDENLDHISIAKIAELADIGKSTVYEHFESKDELILETYKYLGEFYRKRMVAPIKSKTFEKAYRELIKRILKNAEEANELMMSILSEGHKIKMIEKEEVNDMMKNIQNQLQEIYLQVLKLGVNEGIIHPKFEESKEKGHIIRALTIGLIMQRINDHVVISEEDVIDYIYKYTVVTLNA